MKKKNISPHDITLSFFVVQRGKNVVNNDVIMNVSSSRSHKNLRHYVFPSFRLSLWKLKKMRGCVIWLLLDFMILLQFWPTFLLITFVFVFYDLKVLKLVYNYIFSIFIDKELRIIILSEIKTYLLQVRIKEYELVSN